MSQEDKKFSDSVKEKTERVKQHLKDNKKVYLVGAGCLTIGTSIGGAIVYRQLGGIPLEIRQTAKNRAVINWKPHITQVALVKKCCPDPIPVRDLVTGMDYPSISEAVRKTGETFSSITKDAQGDQIRWLRLPDSVFA
jgi:hypothetical protein